jgi:hypothetical protein
MPERLAEYSEPFRASNGQPKEATMRKTQKNGRVRGRAKGLGMGAHHEVSPMARGTCKPNKRTRRERRDRQRKQKGWR